MQVLNIPIDQNGMETTAHGTFSFPIAVYHQVLSKNVLGFINWHWHEEIQFCCVTKGAVRFFVNGEEYLLGAGEGIFVNSGYLHMSRPEGGPESTYLCLDVHPRLLRSYPGSVFDREYVEPHLKDPAMAHVVLRPELPWQKEILSDVEEACRLYELREFGWEWGLAGLLGRMWCLLLKYRENTSGGQGGQRLHTNAAVQAILTYLHAHYAERVTLEEIARAVSFSPGECCRLFKRVTGQTIFTYLQSYRLSKSADLLRAGELSVSQIAYESGFCSTSYFIEVFKRNFGQTPQRFRRTVT